MSFNLNADLVPLFRGLVTGLQPFAKAQDVDLCFETPIAHLYASYNPEVALSEITVLLSRIVTFTPQGYQVTVSINKCGDSHDRCMLSIENTGVDLSKLGELISSVTNGLEVERKVKGTRFKITIPTAHLDPQKSNANKNTVLLPKQYPMYFSEVHKRLANHFSNSTHLEDAATERSNKEGVFLKKVNAVIRSHMADPNFKVDTLAKALALSRTQLFRRMKASTQMSPQQYLRFIRLETANKLLQSNNKGYNVSEVCYKVGFASKSHFTRSFQKEFGFKPSEYK